MSRQTLFWSLIAGIILLGILSYMNMPKLEDPAVPVKQVSVIAIYPGADAHTVELDVAQPLEDALRTLPDVNKIKTECKAGQAMINVEFKKETPLSEIEQHFDIVRRKTADVSRTLPQGCMEPIVVDDMMDVYGLFYAFKADGYTLPEAEKYAKLLRRELVTVPGVKRVNIGGTRSEVINVEFTPDQLKRNGLMPIQLMMALQSATSSIDAGKVPTGDTRMNIQVTEGVKSVEDVRELLLDTPDGKKVRLGDVAKVTRTFTTPTRNAFFVDGKEALTISITLDNSAIVPDVGKAVDAKIAEVMKRMPAGMETEKIFFQPDKVDEAMNGFMLNLLESVVIVVVVLMLFMGWKSGLIIGFGLALTVALSFPILSSLGTTLQRISLGAFIVAMGMLVDNSVVIMDGILVDRQKGLPRNVYLHRIGRNTALPLLGATIIAACTFLPIYMTPGSVGEFAGDLFLVICVSLLVSWVLALIQVPVCADRWIKDLPESAVKQVEAANPPGKFYVWMRNLIEWLIRHRWVAITCAIVLFAASVVGMGCLKQVFFPDFNYKQFVVECYFPGEDDPDVVTQRILAMADSVGQMEDVDRVAVSTGGAPARYCFVRPMPSGGDHYAELIIDCKDFETMNRMTDQVRAHLRAIAPDAYVRTRHYNFSIVSTHTVEAEFTGPDPSVLRSLSAQAEEIMRKSKWVDPYSVQNNWYPRGKELAFNFSQSEATRAGVSRTDVGNALKAAGDGYAVGVFNDGDKMIPIQITMRNPDGSRLSPLGDIPVWSSANLSVDPAAVQGLLTGATSPGQLRENMFRTSILSNVVDSTTLVWSEDFVSRYNSQRAIQAECDPDPTNPEATPAKVLSDIQAQIETIPLPEGYSLRWAGEGEASNESNELLMGNMPMVLLIIFVVLLLLFNNWRKIFLVLICFPFVLCGIVPLLYFTDTPFTFLAILGFMGLIGMMVKNAIVLLDEITRLTTEEAVEEYEAIVRATLSRVRPVMLASFTTILGMIPLISDAMYGSLAVTVIGGLFVGTLVTLLLLPILYSLVFKVKKPKKTSENA